MSLILRLGIALFVGGIGCIVAGTSETRNAALVQETPASMPCSVFQTRGPTDNHHVTLTRFEFPEDLSFVYEEQEYGDGYGVVFMPAFPMGSHEPAHEEFRVLLQFNNVENDDDLLQRISQDQLTGVALRSGRSLDSEFHALLEEGYPGIDVDKCEILHVGRNLPSGKFGFQMKVAGGSMLTAFFGMLVWAFKSDDYIGGGSSQSRLPPSSPLLAADLQEDAEMAAYQQQFSDRYGLPDSSESRQQEPRSDSDAL